MIACKVCGSPFEPKKTGHVLCSRRCRQIAKQQAHGARVRAARAALILTCPGCLCAFSPPARGPLPVFCGEPCRRDVRRSEGPQAHPERVARRAERAAMRLTCAQCGEVFAPARRGPPGLYCSRQCKNAAGEVARAARIAGLL